MSETTVGTKRAGDGWSALLVSPARWIVSVATEKPALASLTDFLRKEGVTSGAIAGVGAVHKVTLSFRDPDTKKYVDTRIDEQLEVTNFTGNIFTVNDELTIHVHGTFGRQDLSSYAGHVKEAWIRGACELFVTVDDVQAKKVPDDETGLNIYNLD